MFATDYASRALGMQVEAVAPGHARIAMTVRDDMLKLASFALLALAA